MAEIVLGGPCQFCGVPHPGQTCEEHQAELNAAARRIVSAMGLKKLAGEQSAVNDDPFDTSDMPTARAHLKRVLSSWRDGDGSADSLVNFIEGFIACKVAEIIHEAARRAHPTSPAQERGSNG